MVNWAEVGLGIGCIVLSIGSDTEIFGMPLGALFVVHGLDVL